MKLKHSNFRGFISYKHYIMCRILFAQEDIPFNISKYLLPFASMCRASKEYQGHGWGFSYLVNNQWVTSKKLVPIWDSTFPNTIRTKRIIIHARSAFENKHITIENNMPFGDEDEIFVFNGELRKVKLNVEGRIGAEKIFNFIKRFKKQGYARAIKRAADIFQQRSEYIRALNIIISETNRTFVYSDYNEDAEYFTLYQLIEDDKKIVCSQRLMSLGDAWQDIATKTIKTIT